MRFKTFLKEEGQDAGLIEVAKTDVKAAHAYADAQFKKFQQMPLENALPHFDQNYMIGQGLAVKGQTVRQDMPVIDEKDVKDFQSRLMGGYFDIRAPFSPERLHDPFPQGLSGEQAKQFVQDGLPKHDLGPATDDDVSCEERKIPAAKLIPIQKQIYLDKCIVNTAKFGVAASVKFLTQQSYLIISHDFHIIDGHHRFFSAILIDRTMPLPCLYIDLPIRQLLPLSLSYSDAIGNRRNM